MSKETLQAGLGVRYHSMYTDGGERQKNDEDFEVRPRSFAPEFHDLERLLPRFRDRPRRMNTCSTIVT